MKKICHSLIVISLLLSPILVLGNYNQTTAKIYLSEHASGPWSVMALTAMGETNLNLDSLKNISSSNAIDYAAPTLAITAANQNPKTFPNEDYVAKLKSFYSQNQIGDVNALNDDIFGILALVSSGEPINDPVIAGAKNFLLQNQNPDGGWSFSLSAASDTNMTATGIISLISAGVPVTDQSILNAKNYLASAQNSDGGFPYDPNSQFGTASDSASTAWVIWALTSLNISPSTWNKEGNNPIIYLESNQTNEGYFEFQEDSGEDSFSPITTAYAVIALSGKTLPLKTYNNSSARFDFRIEGSTETVCNGTTAGPSALDIIKNASGSCGFDYNISETSFGPYLDRINNDKAQGLTGWLYLVNNEPPSVGAADYVLEEGDEVLWYFGDFGWKPTRMSLSDDEISSSQNTTATVEYYAEGVWLALENAGVKLGLETFTANSSGQAQISGPDGYYKVFAEKSGFIRSKGSLLKIGNPASSQINLSVNIESGQTKGTSTSPSTIAFSVNPNNLDFGDLNPGDTATQNFSITNTGSSSIEVEAIVDGDDVFKENLKLNDSLWSKFKASLEVDQNQEVDANLSVPNTYEEIGQKQGSITIWAQ